jgi:hypothetical protein
MIKLESLIKGTRKLQINESSDWKDGKKGVWEK